ncbi:MAG: hypothetical protein J6W24_08695 [Prevotella sp.]|nr:hypothetical protein [Prevotella sp.]
MPSYNRCYNYFRIDHSIVLGKKMNNHKNNYQNNHNYCLHLLQREVCNLHLLPNTLYCYPDIRLYMIFHKRLHTLFYILEHIPHCIHLRTMLHMWNNN